MVNANQKSMTDIHTQKKKEFKYNTKGSHQITGEENRRGKVEKRPMKTLPKQLTKWQ